VGLGLLSYGYGIGTQVWRKDKRIQPHFELVARQVMDLNNKNNPLNLNAKLEPSLSIRLGKKRPSIVIGPSLNMMISDGVLQNQDSESGKTMGFRESYTPIYGDVTSEIEVHFWVGARLGIRI
jgi:hypothetical protein